MNSPENPSTSAAPSVDDPTKNQNPPVAVDQLWTTEQAAHYLRVSLKTVFNLRKKGLPYVQLGGAVRFVPQEIKEYLLANRGLTAHRLRQAVRKGGVR